jgi:divinyl chlorophyllide a 8-vinyl-reductase
MESILLLGATGTIGRAVAAALVADGRAVTALVRRGSVPGCRVVIGEVTDPRALTDALAGVTTVISCLASRTGAPDDARAVDQAAHLAVLRAAKGVTRWVQLSAICVQRPLLAFQHAKLAFEAELMAASLNWTIVRPTAYFKSLSGQVARVRDGKPFLVFGDGRVTSCLPISDNDLARFMVASLDDPAARNAILPIGGPGPALTPLDQAGILSDLLGRPVKVRHVPVALLSTIIGALSLAGRLSPKAAAKAELARIGRYYATQSMLVWTGDRYDAPATPQTGSETLADHYAALLAGRVADDRGEHAVF